MSQNLSRGSGTLVIDLQAEFIAFLMGGPGINTGPVIGSIVRIQKYVYDILGPGVNLAARMENLSEPMGITLFEGTYEPIKDEFTCTPFGEFEIKGFGTRQLFFLDGEHSK